MAAKAAAAAGQINVWLPILTFIAGALLSRFTMSKAERTSSLQVKSQQAAALAGLQNDRSIELMTALAAYARKKTKPTLKDFLSVSSAANRFLYQQKVIADAIMAGTVDPVSRDNTLMPSLIETAERLIPRIYGDLKEIAEKNKLPYPDDFKRENYEGIYSAVEKYGDCVPVRASRPRAANRPPTDG